MCMRYAGCGLVPTNLPAGGFFVVGLEGGACVAEDGVAALLEDWVGDEMGG